MSSRERPQVRLEPWGKGDQPLLTRRPRDDEAQGGPESTEKLAGRQAKYERLARSGGGRMFKMVDEETGEAVGSVGYWEKTWRNEQIYETGWSVLPEFQGRGIAVEATRQAVVRAASDGKHRYLHAFPSVENAPSNAICRSLGSTLLGEYDFEYPQGNWLRSNDWRLDLRA